MKRQLFSFGYSILFLFVFIAFGLSIVLFFRPFYHMEVKRLDIANQSGYEESEIISNFNSLSDYYHPLSQRSFTLATFPYSETGRVHFEEVKVIFNSFFLLGGISFLLLLCLFYKKGKAKDWRFLHSSALYALLLPLILIAGFIVDFNRIFLLFHKLFFRNDFWIFSPETDPIIMILPEGFFMDAALLIGCIILLGCLLLEIAYRRLNKGAKSQN